MKLARPKLLEENPRLSLIDVVKLCAKKWETVDKATKDKLESDYQKEKITYIEKRAQYQSTLTDENRNDLKMLKQDRLEAKEKRAYKARVRDLGKPKRPATPFLRYLVSEVARIPRPANVTYRELQKKISESWNSLSDAAKQPYVKSFHAEDEIYKKKLPQWEEKMIRAGNLDVVRQDVTLLENPPTTKPKAPKTPKPKTE
jgi:transcription factor A, mitochondrial